MYLSQLEERIDMSAHQHREGMEVVRAEEKEGTADMEEEGTGAVGTVEAV